VVRVTYEMTDRTVVITGAGGGVGTAAARRFAAAAATLVLADVNAVRLEELAGELAALTVVHGVSCDVSVVTDVEALMREAADETGRIDVLVNTAGLWVEGPSETMTEADWDRVVDVNLKGTFFCCSRAIPELRKTQGCIVNLSSDCGLVGTPETAIYTASKGGVSLFTKALALELASDLVRVNAVCPADIMTPMLQYQADTYGGGDPEGYFKRLLASYPQGQKARFITPEEVAELIFYLASPAAAPITGANISIDFGTSAGYGYD
jgi:NAD(P)-dependent dehydrogenase (short-subunit alcohol dehydrogenase family)